MTTQEKVQATVGDVRKIVWQAWLALDCALGSAGASTPVETLEATVAQLRAELASREPKCTRVHYEGLYERAKFEEALRVVSEDRDRLRSELAACHGTIGQLSREALHVARLRETSTQQTEAIERLRKDLASAKEATAFAVLELTETVEQRDQLRCDLTAEVQRYAALETQHNLAVEHLESLADNLKAAHEQARDWKLTT